MSKVIIVGAGIGGLTCAIKLKHHGYDVTIIEKNSRIGGKMSQLKKDGFTFDMGPTIVMMPHMYDEIFHSVGRDPNHYYTKTQLNPIYNVYFSKTDKVEVSTDLVHLMRFLEGINVADAAGYLRYLNDIYARYQVAKTHFLDKTFNTLSDVINITTLWNGVKLKTFDTAYHSVSKFVKNEKLRKLLSFQTLYIGISPFVGPSIYSIIPMIEILYGIWFFKGGMVGYIQGLETLIAEMGIKVMLNTEVEEIFVSNNQAKGVVINGDILCADIVINNTDFPYAMQNLIKDEKHRPHYTNKKLTKMDYSSSAFMMYLGLNTKLDHLNIHNLYLTPDFKGNIEAIFKGELPQSPSMYLYVPSKLDLSLAPEGCETLVILVPVPNRKDFTQPWDDALIASYRETVLQRLASENLIEHLTNHIVSETIITPMDWQQHVHAHYGATFGLAPTLRQSNNFRPQPKSKHIHHLYHTGSSIHPGAGIPIVMMSAQLCVNEILKNEPLKLLSPCNLP